MLNGKIKRCLLWFTLFVLCFAMPCAFAQSPGLAGGSVIVAATPADLSAPRVAYLDAGPVINVKMKSIASGADQPIDYVDASVKAIRRASSLPAGFEPSPSNTISAPSSPVPVYIFFENAEEAGILYVFSAADQLCAASSLNAVLYNLSALSDISALAAWDVSLVGDMSYAFAGTSSLADVSPLRSWNTAGVRYFVGTFHESGIIDAAPLASWNTGNALSMSGMFSHAKALTRIDVSLWDTRNVMSMNSLFSVGESYKGNGQLAEITGLANWDVSNVMDMTCMFYGAGKMEHYDIASWDVSRVESFNHMFCDNHSLQSLDLSSWNVSNVKTIFDMFDDCFALTTIGDISRWDTSSLVDAGGWLNGCRSFVADNGTLDLSGWNTENLQCAGEMFRAVKLHTIDISGWTFDAITNDPWPGAGAGIYYESGNRSDYKGLAGMFMDISDLRTIHILQSGYESFRKARLRKIIITDIVRGTTIKSFTVLSPID